MPRKRFRPNSDFFYHVTVRSHNREWFDLPKERVWQIFCDYLFLIRLMFEVEIMSFVLMDNHIHLIISTPKANLDKAMNYFLREVSRCIGFESGCINQKFGAPYHWTLIKNEHHLSHVYKYVYRNPVDAGIVRNVEEYKYSTLHGLLGYSQLIVPVLVDVNLFNKTDEHLNWLNTPYRSLDDRKAIKSALRKYEFIFSLDRNRKHHRLEFEQS